ncbi:hypothetical protein BKA70DRAFT_1214807 [Coprinopsis sp. MPI-PUGE-AT-0042]|nr:hypothetical protein BKA70DRAFT_1214807 [Coprinopsis sp. MPI-PUGE-AT-0042]
MSFMLSILRGFPPLSTHSRIWVLKDTHKGQRVTLCSRKHPSLLNRPFDHKGLPNHKVFRDVKGFAHYLRQPIPKQEKYQRLGYPVTDLKAIKLRGLVNHQFKFNVGSNTGLIAKAQITRDGLQAMQKMEVSGGGAQRPSYWYSEGTADLRDLIMRNLEHSIEHLRDQEQISGAQNRQSWSSFSGQGALADRFHRGRYEPPQASYGSFMPPPLHPLCDAHAHAGMEEAMTPLDYSLCSEASLVYNDIGVWIMDHFPQLNEAQQAAVDNAMGNWDDGAFEALSTSIYEIGH